MKDIFDTNFDEYLKKEAPLAERMRPLIFDSFFGQDELVGKNSPLRKIIQNNNLSSLIFWGPPGVGKTTLARIISQKTNACFISFSAVTTGINEVRKAIEQAKYLLKFKKQRTILFIDEIHRFNKGQQDALLPAVEEGIVILIGATTENPSFEVISPLLSRSAVYILKPLSFESIKQILLCALKNKEKGLGELNFEIEDKALERLINFADSDARAGLNALEFVVNFLKKRGQQIMADEVKKINKQNNEQHRIEIKVDDISKILQQHALRYDKKGEEHYNLISALHKSMRDSNSSASLYWLMRMLESGEDPKFIARRLINFASEDIGNADPQAIQVITAVARAVEYIGMPEAQINLSQAVIYLANAPKDNSVYVSMLKAKEDAKKGSFGVPLHLRNASTSLMKKIGYGKGYQYAHNLANKKSDQTHFPKEIGEKNYFN